MADLLATYNYSPSTVRGSAATFTGSAHGVNSDRDNLMYLHVLVTAISGSGATLTVTLEWSHDGTNFVSADPADGLTGITAVGGLVKGFQIKAPYYRVKEVVAGTTPSVTRVINVAWN